jgi:hypothetical protein
MADSPQSTITATHSALSGKGMGGRRLVGMGANARSEGGRRPQPTQTAIQRSDAGTITAYAPGRRRMHPYPRNVPPSFSAAFTTAPLIASSSS